jgi:1,4-dihydroxy-2-naphthoyl-CoA hydrolase
MRIWKREVNLADIIAMNEHTMESFLGIEFIEIGEDYLKARMPVNEKTRQPYGIMHGGASCVLAETIASVAAVFCVDAEKQVCVGIEINTSHVHSIKSGWVIGTAHPLHLGKSTQLWEIPIEDEEGKLISMNRLRIAVLDKPKLKDKG